MNDICDYSIWTYEKLISHNYYCQIVTHEVCDEIDGENETNFFFTKIERLYIYKNKFWL
jgi:hypothetical protein